MTRENSTLSILQVVADHPGEWGWYQFERTFPPGWFRDELPGVTAKQILDRLAAEDLLVAMPGDGAQPKYHLTERGRTLLDLASTTTPA